MVLSTIAVNYTVTIQLLRTLIDTCLVSERITIFSE